MHSSQTYTAGPAISLRTLASLFPQNEHLRFDSRFFPRPESTRVTGLACDTSSFPSITGTAHASAPSSLPMRCSSASSSSVGSHGGTSSTGLRAGLEPLDSSPRMSLQRSRHSLQMYTGAARASSRSTSRSLFPQKEQALLAMAAPRSESDHWPAL